MNKKKLREHLKKIAPLGGKATLAKKGIEYYSRMAKKRWKKIK
jgi:hypothetical protein